MQNTWKSIKTLRLPLDQGAQEEAIAVSIQTFLPNGKKASEMQYSLDGEPELEVTWKYDNKENPIHEVHVYHQWDGKEEIFRTFDAQGKETEVIKSFNEGGKEITRMEYDAWGNVCQKVICDEDDSIETEEIIHYMEDRMLERTLKDGEGKILLHSVMQYDERGICIEEKTENHGYRPIIIKQNRLKKIHKPSYTIYNADGQPYEKCRRTYDEFDRLTEEIMESTLNGYSKTITRFSYDDNGKETLSETTLGEEIVVRRHASQYHADGWMEKQEIFELNPANNQVHIETLLWEYTPW